MKAPFSLFLGFLLGIAKLYQDIAPQSLYCVFPMAILLIIMSPTPLLSLTANPLTTSLTAAARLTEVQNISVLVIESGFWESDRSADVYDLTHYGCVFETAIDHKFATEIQAIGNRSQVVHSGHGLGGWTLLNSGTWSKYP